MDDCVCVDIRCTCFLLRLQHSGREGALWRWRGTAGGVMKADDSCRLCLRRVKKKEGK